MENVQGPCFSHGNTRHWFEEWRKPDEFFSAADRGVKILFCAYKNVPHFLSEAYIAGAFARIWRDDRGPCDVCLVPEANNFPDAHLKTDGTCLNLEITMALAKDKQMFREWRERQAKAKRGEIELAETTEQRQEYAREAIPRVISKKANKNYGEQLSTTLLVYSDDARALSAEEMRRLTGPWKNCFEAIYILCGMDVVMAWPELRVIRGKEPF